MKSSLVALVLLCAADTFATPTRPFYVPKLKESIYPPTGWTKRGVPAKSLSIELRIALPQPNFPVLEQHLYEVSDPFHERYGQHLSKEEVDRLVAPDPESVHQVNEWLASHGLLEDALTRSSAKDWVRVKVPVRVAEEMLSTEYHVWTNEEGESVVRTTSYSIPEHLHEHIELIQPTTLFSTLRGMKTSFHFDDKVASEAKVAADDPSIKVPTAYNGEVDASCNSTITISCLKQLYNAVGYTPSADIGNQIGITGYLEQYANYQDLQTFYTNLLPEAVGSNFTFVSINGGLNNQSKPGGEATLDVQYAFGLAYPIPGTFYSTAGRPPFIPDAGTTTNTNEPYTDWLDYVLSHPNPPQTISTSYADSEQTVPESFAKRACQGFAQLGARGVSLLFSSGDGGVGDGDPNPATQECFSNDGRNVTRFIPLFPPSCPYVTSVGGTVHIPETAVGFSGGGFSNYFDRPLYQALAVPKYLSKLPKGLYEGLYNPNGRAIPDVAAQADFFRIYFRGQAYYIGGTSAAAPAFAGLVALLNDARIKAKLPTLGFLNPLVYAINTFLPAGFNDITTGNNPGCGTQGFNATKGWDPVTGVGTPNFYKLKDIVTLDLDLLNLARRSSTAEQD